MQLVKVRVNEFYGENHLPLEFPDGWEISEVWSKSKDTPHMVDDEIRNDLDNTIGSENIVEQARGKRGRIVITCDDLSRPTPVHRVLPFIVEQLHEAGVSDNQISILGSFGCHHPMNIDAFARKVGEEAVARFDCVNHNPYDNFENLGRTNRGTPVLVNKEFASADLRICISGVKKHHWAGAGGGGKAVLPGLSSIETIIYNHHMIEGHRPLNRRIWWIKDNPERQDMQEVARMAGLNISVNCVYDEERKLIGLSAGDVDAAWLRAVKECYDAHSCKPPREADIVILNSYPQADQDVDWWGANESLREGGTVVAIHHFPIGKSILHYHDERLGAPWKRMQGYPNRRWPVEKAGRIIFYTNRLSMRHMLEYSGKVEWETVWPRVLERLTRDHGAKADVAIYHTPKLQFNPKKYPLCA